MNDIQFASPYFLTLLVAIPLLGFWFYWQRKNWKASLAMSRGSGFGKGQSRGPEFMVILRLLALCLLILAMARPQTVDVSSKIKTTRGIDIVMAIDVSASMLAKDLSPNRLEALKSVAADFITRRPNDRIGLVEYAGESYTKTPITSDKSIVLSGLRDIRYSSLIEGGTAIGMGLATGVNRLKDSKADSKIIILLTDGVNNTGFIDPSTASELAIEYGIKVYTIGLGTNGTALSPYAISPDGQFQYRRMQVEIDEVLLKSIAEKTGGQYFRATDNEKLEAIYDEIDQLEKTEIEEFKYYRYDELYRPLLLIALGLFSLEMLLRLTQFKSAL